MPENNEKLAPLDMGGEIDPANVEPGKVAAPDSIPDMDPADALANSFKSSYDPEEDIYNTHNIQTLLGEITRNDGMSSTSPTGSSMDNGGADNGSSQVTPQEPTLQDWASGGVTIDPLKGSITKYEGQDKGEQYREAAAAVAGGVAGAGISAANLIDWAVKEGANQLSSKLTGKSLDLKHDNMELPDWLKTKTEAGGLIQSVIQWQTGFHGLDKIGKLGAIKGILSGASELPWMQTLSGVGREAAQEFPKVSELIQKSLEGSKIVGHNFATDVLAFDGQQGNLANLVGELAGNNQYLGKDLTRFLAVNKADNELEARLKNGFVGQLGEVGGVAAFQAMKLAKSFKSISTALKGEIQMGSKEAKSLVRELKQAKMHSEEFEKTFAEIEKNNPDDILDMFTPVQSIEDSVAGKIAHFTQHPHDASIRKLEAQLRELNTQQAEVDVLKTFEGEGFDGQPDRLEFLPGELGYRKWEKAHDALQEQKAKIEEELRFLRHNRTGEELISEKDLKSNGPSEVKSGNVISIGDQANGRNSNPDINNGSNGDGNVPTSDSGSSSDSSGVGSLEVIHADDSLKDASDKILKAESSIQHHRIEKNKAAVKHLLEHNRDENLRAFDQEAFDSHVDELLRTGEPISIQDLIQQHTSVRDLTDIEAFKTNFKNVLQATTKAIKRYESNAALNRRVKNVLAVDLGMGSGVNDALGSAFDSLVERGVESVSRLEEALLEQNGLILLKDHLLPSERMRVAGARIQARMMGDEKAASELFKTLQKIEKSSADAEKVVQLLKSGYGRGLQAGKGVGLTSDDAEGFVEAYEKAKAQAPILAKNTLTEEMADTLGHAAQDLNNVDPSQRGYLHNQFFKALQTAGKVGAFGLGHIQELFYAGVLSHFNTGKNIFIGNNLLKAYENTAEATGAALVGDKESLARIADNTGAYLRYWREGLQAGLVVAAKGTKHPLDFSPQNVRVISADGYRRVFGKSVGDALAGTEFARMGQMYDKVVDQVGHVVNFIPHRMIGGIDTAFRVSNQRAALHSEMSAFARYSGLDPHEFVEGNIDTTTEDLIQARHAEFDESKYSPQGPFTVEQLQNVDSLIKEETDNITMNRPLRSGTYSDRWLFKTGAAIDSAAKQFGIMGTYELPFVKTFVNTVQYGIDGSIGVSALSPMNQRHIESILDRAAGGAIPTREAQTYLGKQVLGSVMALTGVGLAQGGMLSPISGSAEAQRTNKQIGGESPTTITFRGPTSNLVLDVSRNSPLSDMVMIPGKLWQLSNATVDGALDPSLAAKVGISTLANSYRSGSFLRGASLNLSALLNPTASTMENAQKALQQSASGLITGGRTLDNITQYTDPNMRDPSNLWESVVAKIPGMSDQVNPLYDPFGNPRPKDDYVGATDNLATGATKVLTNIGVRYVQNDPLKKELDRFGTMGNTLNAPTKLVSYGGIPVALDQYTDGKGTRLWDLVNNKFSSYRFKSQPDPEGPMVSQTTREAMSALVNSKLYQTQLQDDAVTKGTGARHVWHGSKWTELAGLYEEARQESLKEVLDDPMIQKNFKRSNGNSLQQDLEKVQDTKDGVN